MRLLPGLSITCERYIWCREAAKGIRAEDSGGVAVVIEEDGMLPSPLRAAIVADLLSTIWCVRNMGNEA